MDVRVQCLMRHCFDTIVTYRHMFQSLSDQSVLRITVVITVLVNQVSYGTDWEYGAAPVVLGLSSRKEQCVVSQVVPSGKVRFG